ncbi:enoyl-[acyl-carrier-protein] reductase FabL [bacterium (Candidatus Blackallbacteria) CG17_big_fil_post_rev_8_21_14_2_50_48_46]|uniref:Enoyl-[acyl-carrier-protein] reductase FabL n=1 Tax=bacterium (Candidatus Blackallbacteria) CG17_big_fil_post_rev_8_21_14_2_50_48_46 TaxID=2014261 RepID=A0A2M7G6D8_9BACT|nr:MAG: enoyl-[acyl-carrier-protein] reductase FabL [bacterium (Candidatus Blackallbacteria) CG18_big_fil_WC_8_21_14_2_50_49_26]PIW17588.1 MAG: enoyl-[acyl-carrier-protein] reductase FabL [bacterium (Candidatus Blackallbacteria) CG17_big_fil_post_rev_8_21_14_2_50_48_46]PIW48443.1 MAG: enoyl-[acyl-carrier-protein] reductase FabL [bacterium (Candidatus Blackallbacteria) CG13_big_fil_rev_8_21_14_2_50_49_14]
MELNLNGKTALITGGTRGIGKAIALKLATEGVHLVLNYLRNKRAAEETALEIEALSGQKPLLLKGNIGEPEKLAEMLKDLQAHTQVLDIVISNAASGVLRSAFELTPRHLAWTLDINALALLWLVQGVRPLLSRGAKIVAVSSLGSTRAFPNYAAVGASKAALESLVRHLSLELAPEGININTLSAGVVDTEALNHFPNREELLRHSQARTPAGRLVTPEEVADAALFLCSPLARMVHGHTLVVDGGYCIVA